MCSALSGASLTVELACAAPVGTEAGRSDGCGADADEAAAGIARWSSTVESMPCGERGRQALAVESG